MLFAWPRESDPSLLLFIQRGTERWNDSNKGLILPTLFPLANNSLWILTESNAK